MTLEANNTAALAFDASKVAASAMKVQNKKINAEAVDDLQDELEEQMAANAQRLSDKAAADATREQNRRASQAALIEAHRVADAKVAQQRRAHKERQISRRGDAELERLSRSLSESQLIARERAAKAAKLVRSQSVMMEEAAERGETPQW